jgi:hypothetical protein
VQSECSVQPAVAAPGRPPFQRFTAALGSKWPGRARGSAALPQAELKGPARPAAWPAMAPQKGGAAIHAEFPPPARRPSMLARCCARCRGLRAQPAPLVVTAGVGLGTGAAMAADGFLFAALPAAHPELGLSATAVGGVLSAHRKGTRRIYA